MTISQRLPLTGLPTLDDLERTALAIEDQRAALMLLKQRRLALLRELSAQGYRAWELAYVSGLGLTSVRQLLAGKRGTAVV